MPRIRTKDVSAAESLHVDTKTVSEEMYPTGTPLADDGSVPENVDVTLEDVRKTGAVSGESARRNKADARAIHRKQSGDKNVRFNSSEALDVFDSVRKGWGQASVWIAVQRTEPGPPETFPLVQMSGMKSSADLFNYVEKKCHKFREPATYLCVFKENGLERGRGLLHMYDTRDQVSTESQQQPSPPWGYPQQAPPGWGAPPGYPPPAPPQYPPYANQGFGALPGYPGYPQSAYFGPPPQPYAPPGYQPPPPPEPQSQPQQVQAPQPPAPPVFVMPPYPQPPQQPSQMQPQPQMQDPYMQAMADMQRQNQAFMQAMTTQLLGRLEQPQQQAPVQVAPPPPPPPPTAPPQWHWTGTAWVPAAPPPPIPAPTPAVQVAQAPVQQQPPPPPSPLVTLQNAAQQMTGLFETMQGLQGLVQKFSGAPGTNPVEPEFEPEVPAPVAEEPSPIVTQMVGVGDKSFALQIMRQTGEVNKLATGLGMLPLIGSIAKDVIDAVGRVQDKQMARIEHLEAQKRGRTFTMQPQVLPQEVSVPAPNPNPPPAAPPMGPTAADIPWAR